jgi:uncharacterized membrane protein
MKLSWRTELPQWIVIAAMFVAAAACWPFAPEQMPIHWNFRGEIDGYGNRIMGLLFLPLIVLGVYWLFRLIPLLDPGRKNYAAFTTAYTAVRTAFVFFMAAVYTGVVLTTFGHHVNMTTVACLASGALFLILGNFISKIRPNWFVGVRTPWTLSSKTSWDKTHRLAGWLFILMGLSIAAAGIIQTLWAFVLMIAFIVFCLVWMIIYSYLIYRDDPNRISPASSWPATELHDQS